MTTTLLTAADVKARINTSLSDASVDDIIAEEDRAIVRVVGAHYSTSGTPAVVDNVTETLRGNGHTGLYLKRRYTEIVSITEDGDAIDNSDDTEWVEWGEQGRIERLPQDSIWTLGAKFVVTYKPEDDNDLRRAALVDLVRIALHRTALKSESVGDQYSFSAPEWEAARAAVINRLTFHDTFA